MMTDISRVQLPRDRELRAPSPTSPHDSVLFQTASNVIALRI